MSDIKTTTEIVALLFLSREIAHREHLTTESYAQHMALGSFYEDIIGAADSLAEAAQGCSGTKLESIPFYSNPMKGDILSTMKKMHQNFEEMRKDCFPKESTIQNILDEVDAIFYSLFYKLTFLK